MPLALLAAPIISATFVNLFLFALLWRGDRLEARTGSAPWYYHLGAFLYFAGILGVLYFARGKPVTSGAVVFAMAAGAEAVGAAIAYGLRNAFILSRQLPMKDRAFSMVVPLFLALLMLGTTFFGGTPR